MINSLIFDLDNTLYDEMLYFSAVFKQFCQTENIEYSLFNEILTPNFRLNTVDFFGDALKQVDLYSIAKQQQLFDIYTSIQVDLSLYQDAEKLLSVAKQKNLKLAIITNGVVAVQKNKVKYLNIAHLFDAIIYARSFGKLQEKPHPNSFLYCLDILKNKPTNALFIGDTPKTDIEGANSVGLTSVFLNRHDLSIPNNANYTVHSLTDIIALL